MTTQVDKSRPREVKRKLTAILSADVKGYSRLMGEDEEGTARTLNTYKEIMAGLVERHHGRVVDAPGDNVLAEFASVVDAVRCAVEIQKELKARNANIPENRRMEFRIGINLGDVIEEGDRIVGEGVNIAARMESLSEAGGICISGTAFDHVKNKLPIGYQFLGEQSVKNIAEPVRVYKVLMEPDAAGKVIGQRKVRPKQWQKATIGFVVAVIVVVGAVVIWRLYLRPPPAEVASKEKMAFPLPDKPSIAVLPFVNMNGDKEQEYFSDGISEEIINALVRWPKISIIPRSSSFIYKAKAVDVKQVGREMGVRYVLEGSVRREGNRVRITAQLIDATTLQHLFSERYEREMKDIFAIQDEITMKILTSMRVSLSGEGVPSLRGKGTKNIEAYLKLLQAEAILQTMNRADQAQSKRLAEEAIALDPEYARAYTVIAAAIGNEALMGVHENPREALERALALAEKAVKLDDSEEQAHRVLGFIAIQLNRDYEKGIAEAKRAVELAPNSVMAQTILGYFLYSAGRTEEAIPILKKAAALSPIPLPRTLSHLCIACRKARRYEEAVAVCRQLLRRDPNYLLAHLTLAATFVEMDKMEEARAEISEVLRIDPKYAVKVVPRSFPWKDRDEIDRLIDSLRKAGLPDKPLASIPPSSEVASKEKAAPSLEKVSKPVAHQPSKEEIASKDKMAFPLPDVPSIAVMPFVNMSGDPKQEFLSDGMTEEIITALSKLPGLFVIARTSTSTYKGKPVKVKQVSEELGVRYVLEGSVQRAADRIRINAQFIDALTGRHIWAERYDRDLKDIFALQDEITIKILMAVQVKLQGGDVSRWKTSGYGGKPNLDCYLKHMQAVGYSNRLNPADNNLARRMLEEVIATCPEHPMNYVSLGYVYYFDYVMGNTRSPQETLEKGIELAQKALVMDDSIANAHGLLSRLYSYKGERDKAIAEGERAVFLDPNGWGVLTNYGNTLTEAGRPEEAIPLLQKVVRLNPLGPAYIYANLGRALQFTRRHEEAVSLFKEAIHRRPDTASNYAELGATYVWMGRQEEAIPLLQKAIKLNPNARSDTFVSLGAAFRTAGRYEEAVSAYKEAIQRGPGLIPAHIGLGTTYSLMGRENEARAEAEEVLRINPKFSLDHFAKTGLFVYRDQSEIDKIVNAMRKAGLK
jgi:adenylate cyclase